MAQELSMHALVVIDEDEMIEYPARTPGLAPGENPAPAASGRRDPVEPVERPLP